MEYPGFVASGIQDDHNALVAEVTLLGDEVVGVFARQLVKVPVRRAGWILLMWTSPRLKSSGSWWMVTVSVGRTDVFIESAFGPGHAGLPGLSVPGPAVHSPSV